MKAGRRVSEKRAEEYKKALSRAAVSELLRYTVQLEWQWPGRDPRLGTKIGMGSGTLLHYKGQAGILTAGHCLQDREVKDCAIVSHQPGGLGGGAQGIAVPIPSWCLEKAMGEMNEEIRRHGPDIAFIPLDDRTRRWLEAKTDSVFLNVAKEKMHEGDVATLFAVGHVDEYGTELAEARGSKDEYIVAKVLQVRRYPRTRGKMSRGYRVVELQLLTDETEESQVIELEEGGDEELRRITLEPPKYWRGMSGGGTWWCSWNPERGLAAELEGVTFYQDVRAGETILRAHDREGVEKILREAEERRHRK